MRWELLVINKSWVVGKAQQPQKSFSTDRWTDSFRQLDNSILLDVISDKRKISKIAAMKIKKPPSLDVTGTKYCKF